MILLSSWGWGLGFFKVMSEVKVGVSSVFPPVPHHDKTWNAPLHSNDRIWLYSYHLIKAEEQLCKLSIVIIDIHIEHASFSCIDQSSPPNCFWQPVLHVFVPNDHILGFSTNLKSYK